MKEMIMLSYEDLDYEALLRIIQLADDFNTAPKRVAQTVISDVVEQERAIGACSFKHSSHEAKIEVRSGQRD